MPKDRSVGAALVLTFFFGPLGLLYASPLGALLMFLVAVIVGMATLGLGLLFVWPVTMIWAALAAGNKHSAYQAWLAKQPTTQVIVNPGAGVGLPPAPAPPTSVGQPGSDEIRWLARGERYLLGYTLTTPYYGIWDGQTPGPPVHKYPYSDHGKSEAELHFARLEPTFSATPRSLPEPPSEPGS